MTETKIAPYGSWKSPITADVVTSTLVTLGQMVIDGSDIYWIERRPHEGGRSVIVRRGPEMQTEDVTPEGFNARTRVHEYGGGAYTVADGLVIFANFADQRLYSQRPGEKPEPLTPPGEMRCADLVVDRQRNCLFCVREDHSGQGEAVNTIAVVSLNGGDAGRVIVSGNDFYAAPRLSPDGRQLAWLTWNHPNMPWDGTELWIGQLNDDGSLGDQVQVAGSMTESIVQPEWAPDGTLYFLSDRSGWWNLYRRRNGEIEALHPLEAEFAAPPWLFGPANYALASSRRLICSYRAEGADHLTILDTDSLALEEIETPYTEITAIHARPDLVVIRAGSPSEPASIVQFGLDLGSRQVLRQAQEAIVEEGYLSMPEPIHFPTGDGETAYGYFYPPRNKDYEGPPGERPPLLVISHGGPTGATSTVLNYAIQFWSSRGIAVLDVDYRGSTGYGRAYRDALKGQWGLVDVEDCINGALYLVQRGLVDGDRLAIRGGSAGGYTTLCALTFSDVFDAGASYYGISDLEAMVQETHKYESRYLDSLIGPYPERRDLYQARSPIHHLEQFASPIILFQGLEDKVVLPNQAEMMFDAVKAKGLPAAYVPFAGEQHGFRQAKNIQRALEAELYFYGRVFGFVPAGKIEPVEIENLP